MTRSDRLWSKNYSYSQALRYEDNIDLKELRSSKAIIKKLNSSPKSINDSLAPIKSLYQLLGN